MAAETADPDGEAEPVAERDHPPVLEAFYISQYSDANPEAGEHAERHGGCGDLPLYGEERDRRPEGRVGDHVAVLAGRTGDANGARPAKLVVFFLYDALAAEIYTLSLHGALPI